MNERTVAESEGDDRETLELQIYTYIHTYRHIEITQAMPLSVCCWLVLESARRRRHVKCTYVCIFVCKYLPTHTHTYIWFSACLCMRAVAGRPKQHKLRDEPQQSSCHRPSTTTKKTKPDEIYNPAHPTVKYPTPS